MNDKAFKTIKIGDKGDYRFNKYLFLFASIIILAIAIGMVIDASKSKYNYYTVCNDKFKCFNEYYNNPDCGKTLPADKPICTQEYFYPGQSDGEEPTFLLLHGPEIVLMFLIVLFVFNHIKYNKGFNFMEEE